MATTAKLIGATQSAFTSLMTTELNTLGSANAIIGSTAIDNATNLDLFAEFSFTTGGSVASAGAPYLALYLYPLNGDGSTYGDGLFTGASAGPPPQSYLAGFIGGIATGSRTVVGTFNRPNGLGTLIRLPRSSWKPVLHNGLGVAFSGTGNILSYKTTDLQFV